jgi:hypothetical protein
MKPRRMFSMGMKGMSYCQVCNMAAHVTIPKTKISTVDGHDQLTCFEIMHLPQNERVWFRYDADEKQRRRVCKTHPTFVECRAIVEQGMPRRSGRLGR